MTPPTRFHLGALVAAAMTATLLLTGCAGSPEPATPQATDIAPTPTEAAPEPSATPTAEPASDEDPSCETLIAESVVADFESQGLTSQAEPLYIGSLEVTDGMQCVWADFEGPAGDHGQMFGWARISGSDAADAQAELIDQGWLREEGPEGVYITESPDTTISTDEEGYGMTYLFGDGWVKLADTKQGLLLIEWPKA
ncbi:hypothetical protein [Microbacterium yannicii]|uniref:hypothetical protein n=1 Tax=Microbacterium yannicii TaxID=671622 RepID=UPI0002FE120C|nr:hypothetical protein [Microbacterium yannicii]